MLYTYQSKLPAILNAHTSLFCSITLVANKHKDWGLFSQGCLQTKRIIVSLAIGQVRSSYRSGTTYRSGQVSSYRSLTLMTLIHFFVALKVSTFETS